MLDRVEELTSTLFFYLWGNKTSFCDLNCTSRANVGEKTEPSSVCLSWSHFLLEGHIKYTKLITQGASNSGGVSFLRRRNERSGISPLKLCEYLACEKLTVAYSLPS